MARNSDHNQLKVCDRCGWYDGFIHDRECNPKQGRAANGLAASLAPIPLTKLGYGYGKLTFNLGRHCSVTLNVDPRGRRHSVDHVYLTGATGEEVLRIVRVMAMVLMPHVPVPMRDVMSHPMTTEELAAAQGFSSPPRPPKRSRRR